MCKSLDNMSCCLELLSHLHDVGNLDLHSRLQVKDVTWLRRDSRPHLQEPWRHTQAEAVFQSLNVGQTANVTDQIRAGYLDAWRQSLRPPKWQAWRNSVNMKMTSRSLTGDKSQIQDKVPTLSLFRETFCRFACVTSLKNCISCHEKQAKLESTYRSTRRKTL